MEVFAQIVITKNPTGLIEIKLMSPTKVTDDYTSISTDDAIDFVAECIRILARS